MLSVGASAPAQAKGISRQRAGAAHHKVVHKPLLRSPCACHAAVQAEHTANGAHTTWTPLTVPRLSDDRTSFSEQQRVTAREVGPDQRTNVVGISQMMQVSAPFCIQEDTGVANCAARAPDVHSDKYLQHHCVSARRNRGLASAHLRKP